MPKSITITLTEDETEIIIDALASNLEACEDSASDALAKGDLAAVQTLGEAGARITAIKKEVQAALGE